MRGFPAGLAYIERFKVNVASDKNTNVNEEEFEYFGILKVKLPGGVVVTARQVKDVI